LGSIADLSGAKKRFLFLFTAMSCVFTGTLFFVQKGDIVLGMIFFILAEIGYRSAQVFYNSLLPEIAGPKDIGRISGTGWAIGSAGGILCLLIILPLIMFVGGDTIVRLSVVITAVFFALSAIWIFLWLPERAKPQPLPAGETYVSLGFKRLWQTLRKAGQHREFAKFVAAFLVYNDGILMAMDFAAIMGAVLYGMDQQQLIIFMILVQATSVIGAYFFGFLVDWIGGKISLVVSILLMIGAVVWMYVNQTILGFYFIGALAGMALTGVQSVSRTMVGLFSPEGQSAEFYGMFAVAGRTSSFIGPTVYGLVAAGAAERLMRQGIADRLAEQLGQRTAILSILIFLGLGLLLLLTVKKQKVGLPDV
jgi:UMF1 family MFS transporter